MVKWPHVKNFVTIISQFHLSRVQIYRRIFINNETNIYRKTLGSRNRDQEIVN